MAWAGRIHGAAVDKTGSTINLDDYVCKQVISVCSWPDAWAYFEREAGFVDLARELRKIVDASESRGDPRAMAP